MAQLISTTIHGDLSLDKAGSDTVITSVAADLYLKKDATTYVVIGDYGTTGIDHVDFLKSATFQLGLKLAATLDAQTQDITGTNFSITGATGAANFSGQVSAGNFSTSGSIAGDTLNIGAGDFTVNNAGALLAQSIDLNSNASISSAGLISGDSLNIGGGDLTVSNSGDIIAQSINLNSNASITSTGIIAGTTINIGSGQFTVLNTGATSIFSTLALPLVTAGKALYLNGSNQIINSNIGITATDINNITTLSATNVNATALSGSLTGNASTATTLETSRTFSITGDITANAVSFDGSGNVVLNASLNGGAGSGIDADTLDSLQAIEFTRWTSDGSYYGLHSNPGGIDTGYLRTPAAGLIPHTENLAVGSGTIGTTAWPFLSMTAKTFYGDLSGNATSATNATTHINNDGSDHDYINQDVKSTSHPFFATYLEITNSGIDVAVTNTASTGLMEINRTSAAGEVHMIAATDVETAIYPKVGEYALRAVPDGATELYYNGAKKITTSSVGAEIDGEVHLTGGSAGVIDIETWSALYQVIGKDNIGTDKTVFFADPEGPSSIYYAGSAKVTTTNTGINVTGGITATNSLSAHNLTATGGNLFLDEAFSEIKNIVNGGTIYIKGNDNGGVERQGFWFDPDIGVKLYSGVTTSLETTSSGIITPAISTNGGTNYYDLGSICEAATTDYVATSGDGTINGDLKVTELTLGDGVIGNDYITFSDTNNTYSFYSDTATANSTIVTGYVTASKAYEGSSGRDFDFKHTVAGTQRIGYRNATETITGYEFFDGTGFNNLVPITCSAIDTGNGSYEINEVAASTFAGSGVASTTSRSDHTHSGVYAPVAHNHDSAYSLKSITRTLSGSISAGGPLSGLNNSSSTVTVALNTNEFIGIAASAATTGNPVEVIVIGMCSALINDSIALTPGTRLILDTSLYVLRACNDDTERGKAVAILLDPYTTSDLNTSVLKTVKLI